MRKKDARFWAKGNQISYPDVLSSDRRLNDFRAGLDERLHADPGRDHEFLEIPPII